jgi:hypothetical protein
MELEEVPMTKEEEALGAMSVILINTSLLMRQVRKFCMVWIKEYFLSQCV